MKLAISPLMLVLFLALPFGVLAQVYGPSTPDSVSFQGYITDPGGAPVTDTLDITTTLYKGGVAGYTQVHQDVMIQNGLFNVMIGPLDTVQFNQPIEVGFEVGGDPEMSPRTPLVSTPYALGVRGMHAIEAENASYRGLNILGGWKDNYVAPGVVGATIAGGGAFAIYGGGSKPDSVTGDLGFVGGGAGNAADWYGVVVGGQDNREIEGFGFIGGGEGNVAGGQYSVIAGGVANRTSATGGVVGGGFLNEAGHYGTVGGGSSNEATGANSVIPGGQSNVAAGAKSFAAGTAAHADHTGAFVWADANTTIPEIPWPSTGDNQFLIRAAGGVGIGTNTPGSQLTVHGMIESDTLGFKFPDGSVQATAAGGGGAFWSLSGNAGTDPTTDFIGTTDSVAFEIRINDTRRLRIEPGVSGGDVAPNVVIGGSNNYVAPGIVGATIGGGGGKRTAGSAPDSVTGNWGTVSGGRDGVADYLAVVGGGRDNKARGVLSTVGGGSFNSAIGNSSTVAGGNRNAAAGQSGTIGGGEHNLASGSLSTVPGGEYNAAGGDYAFAAGFSADANHNGSFVWADRSSTNQNNPFSTTAENQFLIRAAGGVGIGTNSPGEILDVLDAGGSTGIKLGGAGTDGPHGIIFDDDTADEGVQLLWRTVPNQLILERTSEGTQVNGTDVFTYDRDDDTFAFLGSVGIGTSSPATQFHVTRSVNAAASVQNHVAVIDNTSTGTSADVLALRVGRSSNPDTTNSFISFKFNGNTSAGFIRGNGNGGIELVSSAADIAEYLPKLDPAQELSAGDVVGIFSGHVSLNTAGADQVMAVSTAPIVVGNDRRLARNSKSAAVKIAFIGQVPVRVRGAVETGDFLVPSGLNDGTAVAVIPEAIRPDQLGLVFATAWEGSPGPGENLVNAAVGVDQVAAASRVIQSLQERDAERTKAIKLLEQRVAQLERAVLN